MVKSPRSPASPLSSCSSEIEDAAIWNHVANSLNMEITDLDNLVSCDGISLFDRVAAAVEASCSAGGLRGDVFGAIDEVLEGEEWLDYSELESNCPCLAGILDGMLSNGTEWLCNSLTAHEGSQGRVTTITSRIPTGVGVPVNFFDDESERFTTAITMIGDRNLNPVIVVRPELCDGSYVNPVGSSRNGNSLISIVTMFIHEGYHARFRHEVSQLISLPATNDDIQNFRELFRSIYVDEVGGWECGEGYQSGEEHEILVRKYIFDIAFALWEFNGFRGQQDDYVFAAGGGLLGDYYAWSDCALNFFTQSELDDFKNRHNALRVEYPLLFQEPCR